MSARDRILERRAAFVAAAIAVSAAGMSACDDDVVGPTVCLEPSIDCDASPGSVDLVAPKQMCVGDKFKLEAYMSWCGDGSKPVFATSDPNLLVVDGSTAIALKPGKVTITALMGKSSGSALVEILPCADGGVDAGPGPASDAGSDATGDVAPSADATDAPASPSDGGADGD
ncbi:MAG: hypothetical protein HYV09_00440 [Deltaproteobacteria bacterium]|nr:hypothetical protein [Deltaproteobacteria bacterium]